MFDLVIFDCDGVLIDSEIISAQMLVEELAPLGVRIDLDYVARFLSGLAVSAHDADLRAAAEALLAERQKFAPLNRVSGLVRDRLAASLAF